MKSPACYANLVSMFEVTPDGIRNKENSVEIPDVNIDIFFENTSVVKYLSEANIHSIRDFIVNCNLAKSPSNIENLGSLLDFFFYAYYGTMIDSITSIYSYLYEYSNKYYSASFVRLDNSNDNAGLLRNVDILKLALPSKLTNGFMRNNIRNMAQVFSLSYYNFKNIRYWGATTVDSLSELKKCYQLLGADDPMLCDEDINISNIVKKYVGEIEPIFADESARCRLEAVLLHDTVLYKKIIDDALSFENKHMRSSLADNDPSASELTGEKKRVVINEAIEMFVSNNNHYVQAVYDYLRNFILDNRLEEITAEYLLNNTPVAAHRIVNDFLANSDEVIHKPDGTVFLNCTKCEDYIRSNISSSHAYDIFKGVISGKSIAAIAREIDITKQRVRQIYVNISDYLRCNPNVPVFAETRYLYLFTEYNMSKEDYVNITHDDSDAYEVLSFIYERGHTPIKNILSDTSVPGYLKNNYDVYVHTVGYAVVKPDTKYANLYGYPDCDIQKSKLSILEYIVRTHCKDDILVSDLYQIYCDFVESCDFTEKEKSSYIITEAYFVNKLALPHVNVLTKFGKRVRYYRLDRNFDELLSELDLRSYNNIEYSTYKFFAEHSDLMARYDIRDEYELHNLFRKLNIEDMYENITLGRSPMITFGNFNRSEAIRDILKSMGPSTLDDIQVVLSEKFGYRSAKGFILGWMRNENIRVDKNTGKYFV